MQTLINKLETQISDKTRELEELNAQLNIEKAKPENNIYVNFETACDFIQNALENKAAEDCEGAYNCGNEQYEQLFMVANDIYKGVLSVEYNRHDKTYYYIEDSKFEVIDVFGSKVDLDT